MVGLFSEGRETASKAAGFFKTGASETFQVYPLIRRFLIEHIPAACVATERASFLALCHVADLVQEAKFCQTPEAVRGNLLAARVLWRNAHEVAYGKDLLVPKHHFSFHLPTQTAIWLDCFTHVRKHCREGLNGEPPHFCIVRAGHLAAAPLDVHSTDGQGADD